MKRLFAAAVVVAADDDDVDCEKLEWDLTVVCFCLQAVAMMTIE